MKNNNTSKLHRYHYNSLLNRLPHWLRKSILKPPKTGDGVHQWLFKTGLQLHRHLNCDEIFKLLSAVVSNCGREVLATEIQDAINNSKDLTGKNKAEGGTSKRTHKPRSKKWPSTNVDLRSKIITETAITVDKLKAASPLTTGQPSQDTKFYIKRLMPGNPLLCIGSAPDKCDTTTWKDWQRFIINQNSLIVPSPMSATYGVNKKSKRSFRCLDNTGPRCYVITEFDGGTLDEQASLLWHLKQYAPLVMVLWSGSKSLHAWWNTVDVPEETTRRFFNYAVSLGADRATWTRCQLVRLPEGWREDKGVRQHVLYFDTARLPKNPTQK